MKKFGYAASAIVLGIISAAASAADFSYVGDLYVQGGTQGVGIGYAMPLTPWMGLHADINGFGTSHTFTSGGNTYNGHLHLLSSGAYFDLFPIPSSAFRLTAGLLFNDDKLSGNAAATNGTYTINGKSYIAPPGTVASASAKYPAVMPYFGVGFGHKPVTTRGLGFTADLGVAYGNPHVSYTVSPVLVALAGANNVAAEEQNIQNTVSHYRFYPIVQIGATYHF